MSEPLRPKSHVLKRSTPTDQSTYVWRRIRPDKVDLVIDADGDWVVGQVANGEQIYRCSQHGFRGTPRCNDNPACSLQLGVWVGITTEDNDDDD